ncbi:hypothetical protein B7R22_08980 [Subtercola boreus]|uniref:Anaphase-promoting complex subunit 4 WD40 domain-containing protein n=1 Tax=Subtercola boreus TaxID=120213 RepID=A0A3E0VYZ6_9MICO|nr:hypothetical protein B7R22_08980 [Subtercola boreus]
MAESHGEFSVAGGGGMVMSVDMSTPTVSRTVDLGDRHIVCCAYDPAGRLVVADYSRGQILRI